MPDQLFVMLGLAVAEWLTEATIFAAYVEDPDTVRAIGYETSLPAGYFAYIKGFEQVPLLSDTFPGSCTEIVERLKQHVCRHLSDTELLSLRETMRAHYEVGPGGQAEIADDESDTDCVDDEQQPSISARTPIPPESFLEELSAKIEVHPLSVYAMLKEGIERDGWLCLPEEMRFACDRVTVLTLRFSGHLWPRQIENGELAPSWADRDGIIPLTEGTNESLLIDAP